MAEKDQALPLPAENKAVADFLRLRRSNLVKLMEGSGPDAGQLAEMLETAARVPDHRKLAPWRFVTFEGQARADFGQHIASAFMKANPDMPQDRALFEGQRFLRAPNVVAVISSPVKCARGTPEWEQVLSAGAVCYNLLLAAQSRGFAAQWLTEWYAYDKSVQAALGLTEGENIAGFIYIGRTNDAPSPRTRPNLDAKTSAWTA